MNISRIRRLKHMPILVHTMDIKHDGHGDNVIINNNDINNTLPLFKKLYVANYSVVGYST